MWLTKINYQTYEMHFKMKRKLSFSDPILNKNHILYPIRSDPNQLIKCKTVFKTIALKTTLSKE